ncbi:MAG: hypothetical protein RQ736_11825 [Thiogranum sp.]|nr:hypothetical protein [Thiogranum sp.]
MKAFQTISAVLLASVFFLALPGCDTQQGPAESAGESIDEAAARAGDKIEDAGEAIEDAVQGDKN